MMTSEQQNGVEITARKTNNFMPVLPQCGLLGSATTVCATLKVVVPLGNCGQRGAETLDRPTQEVGANQSNALGPVLLHAIIALVRAPYFMYAMPNCRNFHKN